MSHQEEEKPKKKSKAVKAIFKLLTLGGLLVIIFKALQKQKESSPAGASKDKNKQ